MVFLACTAMVACTSLRVVADSLAAAGRAMHYSNSH